MTTVSAPSLSASTLNLKLTKKASSITIIKLVDSERCSIPFLREPEEPHFTLNNFSNLIKKTPFQRFREDQGSSKSLPHSMTAPHISFSLSRHRSRSPMRSGAQSTRNMSSYSRGQSSGHSPGLPKSRFLEESKRKLLEVSRDQEF